MALFQEEDSTGLRFTVRPNCALSWRWTKRVILLFAACLVAVGCYFASQGAWLVVPFAGLELVVLAAGFYLSALAGNAREVVEVSGNELRVLRGGSRLREVAVMSRHWTSVRLHRDPRGWHPSRLVLRCHGRSVEILTRLVESEREELASALEAVIGGRRGDLSGALAEALAPKPPVGDLSAGCLEGEAHAMSSLRFGSGGGPGAPRVESEVPGPHGRGL